MGFRDKHLFGCHHFWQVMCRLWTTPCCAQGLFMALCSKVILVVLTEPYVVPRIKSGLAACKATTFIPYHLSAPSPHILFILDLAVLAGYFYFYIFMITPAGAQDHMMLLKLVLATCKAGTLVFVLYFRPHSFFLMLLVILPFPRSAQIIPPLSTKVRSSNSVERGKKDMKQSAL